MCSAFLDFHLACGLLSNYFHLTLYWAFDWASPSNHLRKLILQVVLVVSADVINGRGGATSRAWWARFIASI